MSKRELQRIENQLAEQALERAKKVWNNASKELDYCQASTYQTRGYLFLISYGTIVAFVDDSGILYDVLRLVYGYTSTSAKHISKFRNKFRHVASHTWREV